MPALMLNGPVGALEARYHPAENPEAPIALLLHPNPQFGGNMNTLVTYTLFTVFQDTGFNVLRFNFRGVGKSAGLFTGCEGELGDALAAWDWLCEKHPSAKQKYVAGFSFGSWIGIKLLEQRTDVNGFIAVAPPVNRLDYTFVKEWKVRTLVIHGAADQLVPESAVQDFVNSRNSAGPLKADFCSVPGASHFFETGAEQLSKAATEWLNR